MLKFFNLTENYLGKSEIFLNKIDQNSKKKDAVPLVRLKTT